MAFRAVRDLSGQIVDFEWLLANPRAEAIVGRPAAELVGQRLLVEMPGNREAGLFDMYARVVETGKHADHSFFYNAEGIRAWFHITAVKLDDGFAVTFRDITREKDAEETRTALAQAQMAIFDVDVASGLISRSESLDLIFGFVPDGTRRTLDDLWARIHPDDIALVHRFHTHLVNGRGEQYIEHRIIRPGGSIRWVGVRGRLTADEHRPPQIHSLLFDITERKQAEEALRESEARYRVLTEAMPQHVWRTDAEGRVVYVNSRWLDYTGQTAEQAHTTSFQALHQDDIPAMWSVWESALANGQPYEIEFRLRRYDGVYRWHLSRALPVRDDTGAITGWIGTTTDIHGQKQSEEHEREARIIAEGALMLRDQFLTVASHELKTPLTALLGHTQLMQRRLAREEKLSERDRRTTQLIVEQADRLSRLITTMLDVSRLQSGEMQVEVGPCDLRGVVTQAIREIVPALGRHPIELREGDAPLPVAGDPLRLGQVIYSLLGNAAKYSPEGSPIRVELTRDGDSAVLVVADQGIGIPAEAMPHIFGRFYRAANADANKGISGMGVGLYVVREIVIRHGGSVEVVSEEGIGSTFTVRLPLLDEDKGAQSAQIV
jgi:PAS domain S-box-containing protein